MSENKFLISAEEVIKARTLAKEANNETYDFGLMFSGGVLGIDIKGVYDGKYRGNKEAREIKFERTTSGTLAKPSTVVIEQTPDSKNRYLLDKNRELKKRKVVEPQKEDISMVNKPFVSLVNVLKAGNLKSITKSDKKAYKYKAILQIEKLAALNNNPIFNFLAKEIVKHNKKIALISIIWGSFKDVILYFNIDNEKVEDFLLAAEVDLKIKQGLIPVPVTIKFNYSQKYNDDEIQIPEITEEFLAKEAEKIAARKAKMAEIGGKISKIKTSAVDKIKSLTHKKSKDVVEEDDFDEDFDDED